jgi:hypothetical protein
MRRHIRSWVNAWDLMRLYKEEAHTVSEDIAVSLDEDLDMQTEPDESTL